MPKPQTDPKRCWKPDYLGLTLALKQWAEDAQQLNDEELGLLCWHLMNTRDALTTVLLQRQQKEARS